MSKRKTVAATVQTPVERDPRPSVEAIRAAAFTQFAERGYPVVTVRDIMKACGLTQGALYNHFKSKDELLHDIITSTQAELERLCLQAVGDAGDDPRATAVCGSRRWSPTERSAGSMPSG
jgi:AcrR family transcriptional regulator